MRQRFDVADDETVTPRSHTLSLRGLAVRSLTDHWSTGVTGSALRSSFLNYRLRTRFGPGVEYDVFPYSESTRRLLTIFYSVGLQTLAYREETLLGHLTEVRPDHQLQATLTLLQPWGTAFVGAGASQYLTMTRSYRLTAEASLDVRLSRGLAFDVSTHISQRRDQINLPRGDATDEEILLQLRELETDYEYGIAVGFSYTFGSIFNNVVNPRLRAAEGL
jgi:hypothetical protein